MGLPVNIEELLHGHTVEWDRIECKRGWNPEEVIRTICAFANDLNNWGGGYIFIGVDEKDGMPVLPPVGIPAASLDNIQKELLNLCYKIHPNYVPVSQPYLMAGRHIFVIWAPGGDNRPYKAPATLGEKGQHRYYIRRGSSSVVANQQEERLLLEMAKRIPFDDRVNHQANIGQLSLGVIRSFLQEIKSELWDESVRMPLAELAQQMRIAAGPPEAIHPLNVGLLFFSEQPDVHFRGARTEVVLYEDISGIQFTEKIFTGPLHIQLRNALSFIETNVLKERVIKMATRAEAQRIYNFPPAAVEEIVANAFYHRSYELDNPIEINCFPDRLEVLSFPGPLPPVNKQILKQKRIVARDYRNRRVGDFLRELRLTEGRATGFPTIYESMERNGSPQPVFDTDDNFSYFLSVLPIHPHFQQTSRATMFVREPRVVYLTKSMMQVLQFCITPRKRSEVLSAIGLDLKTKNYKKHIEPLMEGGLLALVDKHSIPSPQQYYFTTKEGIAMLQEINEQVNN